jgi:hypothetical protein
MVELQTPEDPFERFVLLAVAELSLAGETPVHSFDVRECCGDRTAHVSFASGDAPDGGDGGTGDARAGVARGDRPPP